MKLFLDTADLAQIRRAHAAGLVDGITTNPTLLSRVAGKDQKPRDVLAAIADVVKGPISAEVVAADAEAMVSQGRKLAKIASNIVIKVPLTEDGLRACRTLRSDGIGVNVTLCFSATQALLAAKAGATFISPFVGRIDDVSGDGMDLIRQIVEIYHNYDFETEVLVASVRHPRHVLEAALIGADVATVPFEVAMKLFNHPLTDKGLAAFLADWEKLPESERSI